jgi:MFS family permease
VWFESRAHAPMMPPHLFRSRNFAGANLITLLLYFALSGSMFFVPFNLIQVQGYSAAAAGASFLPFTLIMGVLSRWSGGLIDRFGARKLLTVGPAITAVGVALLAVPGIGGSYWTTFFPSMVVQGFGMAVAVAPLTTTVMRALDDRYAGVASGVNNAVARIAGMLAVALLGAIAVGVFGNAVEGHSKQMNLPSEARELVLAEIPKLAEAQVPRTLSEPRREQVQRALDESFVQSFRVAQIISALLALASGAFGWLMIREPRSRA